MKTLNANSALLAFMLKQTMLCYVTSNIVMKLYKIFQKIF